MRCVVVAFGKLRTLKRRCLDEIQGSVFCERCLGTGTGEHGVIDDTPGCVIWKKDRDRRSWASNGAAVVPNLELVGGRLAESEARTGVLW